MIKHLLIILLLTNALIASAQTDNFPLSLGIGGGIDLIKNTDLSASPLTYEGMGLPVGINGFQANGQWINQFEIQLIIPFLTNNYPLRSKADTQLKDWTKVSVKYQLLRSVGENSNSYLGGAVQSSFFFREYDFLDGLSWEFQNSLNVQLAHKVNISDNSFLLPQLSKPVLTYINRKPSLTFDEVFLDDFNENGAASLLKYGQWKLPFFNWSAFEFDVLYHLKLSEKLNLQGKVGFNYYRINFPEKVTHLNVPIRCYLNYQL
ncbi:MAG: hypothetical protein AB8G22_27120 [Saprospiraceae bacterium]